MASGDVATLLGRYSPAVRATALKARAAVRKAIPGATEKVYFGWRNIFYTDGTGMKGMYCAVCPYASYVNVMFFGGKRFKDPKGLLIAGTGKSARLKLEKPADAARVRAFALQAAKRLKAA